LGNGCQPLGQNQHQNLLLAVHDPFGDVFNLLNIHSTFHGC
jgi:hypothetical protein